jgi:uncharacterized protein (TIGR02118 family)
VTPDNPQPEEETIAANFEISKDHARQCWPRYASVPGSSQPSATRGKSIVRNQITVIYDNPTDPDAFEAAYESEQLEAARRIPGYLRLEASKVWPKEDGSPTPAYRMIDVYYPDYAAVSTAVTTPEAGAFFAAMTRLATGGVRVLVSDVEVPQP